MEMISVQLDVCHGKPCIKGTRIMVEQVLDLIEAGKSFHEIIERYYPDVAVEDLQACVRFAKQLVSNEDIHVAEERLAG